MPLLRRAALLLALALSAALLAALIPAAHAGEFVYQGHLDDRGAPANGRVDLRIGAYGGEQSLEGFVRPPVECGTDFGGDELRVAPLVDGLGEGGPAADGL